MPFKIPKKQLKWKIDGMYFWANDIAIKKEGGIWSGYSIDRKDWDKWLASMAIKQGVKLFTGTRLLSLKFGNKFEVTSAITTKSGKKIVFEPKYVIGADGVDSTVIDLLNVKKTDSIGYAKSYEMKNLELKYPGYDQLFFGEFAPKAYAYIFPLSETAANVGVGTVYKHENLDDLFEKFTTIPFIKRQISEGKIVSEKSGDAPIKDLSNKLVYGSIFLVGDAANQNIKPFIEGNIPGIICGNMLGEFIYDVSKGKKTPEEYEYLINEKFHLIAESQPFADIVYGDTEIEMKFFNLLLLGLMSEIIPPEEKDIEYYVEKGYDFLKEYIIKNGGFIEQ
jgi:flavin-dependent dehydrogenase